MLRWVCERIDSHNSSEKQLFTVIAKKSSAELLVEGLKF